MPEPSDIQKIEQAIAALETQRAVLGDAVVDAALGPLREKLASLQPSALESEAASQQRKVITVLFADIPALSHLSEKMDAEDARDAMDVLWRRLDAIIVAHGGHIDKHLGDGVMALWGAEIVREDDAERAIRAALALQSETRSYRIPIADLELKMRIGINTGPVIVGFVGTTGEFTAMGDTVNLAARLEQNTAPDTILISHSIFRLVRGVFDVDPQAPMTVKGKAEPIQTYIVERARPRAFRLPSRGVEGIETRMIGRNAELDWLKNTYYTTMRDRIVKIVTISGDAGIGKSRLLSEFNVWFDLEPTSWLVFQGRASPAMTDSPFSFLRDIFSFRFNIQDSDPLSVAREKFEQGFREQMPDDPRVEEKAHFVGHLLGFDYSGSSYLKGILQDPKQIRSQALHFFTNFFQTITQHDPVLMMMEDVHWSDGPSLGALAHLANNLTGAPVLGILLGRPVLFERFPQWGMNVQNAERLDLHPLAKEDSRNLVQDILRNVHDLPTALVELIVGGAEGNPFYVEELIKMLIEGKVIKPGDDDVWRVEPERLATVHVPPTLTGVLQSRLDNLAPVERIALQRAAVIGRTFWDHAVAALGSDQDVNIVESLNVLKNKELIFLHPDSVFAGVQEYSFKQTLLRDVAYDTVLKRQRSAYHLMAAQWLENVSGGRRGDYLSAIAYHYEKAGEPEKASTTLFEAGERALSLSGFNEARNFFVHALEVLPSTRPPLDTATLQLKTGEAFLRSGEYGEAMRRTEMALSYARTADDHKLLAGALTQIGNITAEMGSYAKSREYFFEALPIARAVDEASLARVLFGLGNVSWRLGNLDEARAYCVESHEIATRIGDTSTVLFALNRLGVVMGLLGNQEEEERLYRETLTIAMSVGNRERAAVALNNLGALADERGDLKKAQEYYTQAMGLAREIGAQQSLALYLINLAHSQIRLGDFDSAPIFLREGLALAMRLGASPWALISVIFFARLFGAQGNYDRALGLIGLVRTHAAYSPDHQRIIEQMLVEWNLPEERIQAGLDRGAKLHMGTVIADLLAA